MTSNEVPEAEFSENDWSRQLDTFARILETARYDAISLVKLRDDLTRIVDLLSPNYTTIRLRTLRLLAETSMRLGEYDAAYEILVNALEINDEDGVMRDSARLALAEAAIRSKRQDEALAVLERSKRPNESEVGTALAIHEVLISLDRRFEAIQRLEDLLAQDCPNGPALAAALHSLGILLDETGRSHEALSIFSRAEEAVDSDFIKGQSALHNSKSVTLLKIGRIDEAVKEADKAVALAQSSGNMSDLAVALLSRGNACNAAGQTDLALQHFHSGLVAEGRSNSREHEVTLLNNIALCYLELGQLRLYMRYLLWALDVADELDDLRAKAMGLCNLATFSSSNEARVLLTEAYAIYIHLEDRAGQAGTLHQLAVAVEKDGYIEDALQHVREALDIAQEIADPQLLMLCHGQIGSLLAGHNEPESAWNSYMQSLSWAETVRRETNVALVRLNLIAEVDEFNDAAIELAANEADKHVGDARQQWLSRLFSVLERARARVLIDQMGSDSTVEEDALPEDVRRMLTELTNRVRMMRNLLAIQDAPGKQDVEHSVMSTRLASARRQLANLHAYLEQSHPRFGALSSTDPVSLDWLASVVPDDVAIIEFANAGDNLISLTYMNRELSFARHGSMNTVQEIDKELRDVCLSFDNAQRADELSAQLGTLVLDPILSNLPFHDIKHLLIIPALDAFSVSLDSYRLDGRYLFEQFSVSYLPSVSVAQYLANDIPVGDALVIGDPDGSLPYARQEALEISEVLHPFMKPQVLIGSAATKQKFIQLASTSQIIHIASHAMFRHEAPEFATIMLGGSEPMIERDLEVADIMRLRLPSTTVVLSGCDTGLGTTDASNEMIGLVRSFLCVGASAVVAARWPIRDVSACEFMRIFYRYLIADQEHPAEALRMARTEHIRLGGYSHPGHWAPYVIFGTPPTWNRHSEA